MPAEVETMFSVREVPWHKLGTIVEDKLTAKEALVAAGLDWEVDLEPVFTRAEVRPETDMDELHVVRQGDKTMVYSEVPGKQAVVRDSDNFVLEIVGSRYAPVQNWRSFEFFDTLVDSGDAKYETAGALDHGRRVWITCKVPREMKIGGVDPVEMYLLLANSHDGSLAFQAAVTPVRVVCQNTLNLALSASKVRQKWSLRHTESIDSQIEVALQALGMTFKYADAFEKDMNALMEQEFTKAEFERMVKEVFPAPVNEDGRFSTEQYSLIGSFESSPTLDQSFRYTRWGALNAIREFDDWGKQVQKSETVSEAERRTARTWFGENVGRSNRVLAYLTK